MIGKRIGNFEITKRIGSGGMGEVFVAEHPKIGRLVAIKVLNAQLSAMEDATARFLTEAKAATKIRHPNVIEVFDFGTTDDGRLYQVMELLSGQTLTRIIKHNGKMSPAEIYPYLQQICEGLRAAHDIGVVHRDLKPDNIYVQQGEPPLVKLLDFGLVKMTEGLDKTTRTMTGMVLGTPLYISPEQAAGRPKMICPQTDIYSLGVILFQMLTGELPFEDESITLLMAKHITEEPPSLIDFVPAPPTEICAIVDQCLAKEPSDRPASAEVAARFREVVQASSDVTLPPFEEDSFLHVARGKPNSQAQGPLAMASTEVDLDLLPAAANSVSTLTSCTGEVRNPSAQPAGNAGRRKLIGGLIGVVVIGAVVVLSMWGGSNRSDRIEQPGALTQPAPAKQTVRQEVPAPRIDAQPVAQPPDSGVARDLAKRPPAKGRSRPRRRRRRDEPMGW